MAETVQIGESANGLEIELQVHQTLEICLPEVRTAGYRWWMRLPGEPACRLVKDYFEPPATGTGGSGVHHWEFRALESGTAKLEFNYTRSWERATTSARTFTVSIRVS